MLITSMQACCHRDSINLRQKLKSRTNNTGNKGNSSVTPLQVEAVNTIADHHLLFNLAKKHGGSMVYPNELEKLNSMIMQQDDVKTITYSEKN